MSLSPKNIDLILNLLNEDTCGSTLTFEQVSNEFQQGIAKTDYFRVGNALVLLLQNRDLTPTVQQRLIIFFLFMEICQDEKDSIDSNPFAPVFLAVLQPKEAHSSAAQKHFHWIIAPVTKCEQVFVHLLLYDKSGNYRKALLKKTPDQIIQSELSLPLSDMNLPDESQRRQFKEKISKRAQQVPVLSRCHLPAVIDDPKVNHYAFDTLMGDPHRRSKDSRQTSERLLSSNVMKQTIHPEYLRIVPPLHECTLDELAWLSPISDSDNEPSLFAWDSSMCLSESSSSRIRQLMEKAYRGEISTQQQQELLEELNNNPDLIYQIGFLPSKLPLLVENSPSISIHCLSKLISSDQLPDYLQYLAQMDMSVHSIGVVNRLSTLIQLPHGFLHLFISTCIRTCNQTKDKYLQNRFVRLVSVLIQSLIRNKVIQINDHFLEIEQFCGEFQRIKEADALFQLLQTLPLHPNDRIVSED